MTNEEKFADAFREEAIELLSNMEEVILLLENDSENEDLINRLFRIMHTIKGSGAMFGFQELANFAHHLETTLDLVRNKDLSLTAEFIDLLLQSKDQIQGMVYAEGSGADSTRMEDILIRLKAMEDHMKPQNSTDSPPATPTTDPSPPFPPSSSRSAPPPRSVYRLRIKLNPKVMATGMEPLCLLSELQSLGECTISTQTDQLPPLEKLDPELCYFYWDVMISTLSSFEELQNVFLFIEDESEISITPLTNESINESIEGEGNHKRIGEILVERGDITQEDIEHVLAKQKRVGEMIVDAGLVDQSKVQSALAEQDMFKKLKKIQSTADVQNNTIRVSTEKLDRLINLVGEMVITQAQLSQTSTRYKDQDLLTPIENVERLTNELRDCALNIRMLPIETTFDKFRRLVRDLSAGLGKNIDLVTEGGETELDKTVIERIHDPLVHLIRNSIDHGIELPKSRLEEGKPSKGTIHLMAGQAGGEVIITIQDDGAGLDREKIRAKGIERNLISESDNVTDSQIFDLIFQPGFSTASKVTDVSGRGVGMDVVKREITKLRGSVGIESTKGKGTKISIHLPLTLAIIEGLLIGVDSMRYIIPLTLVRECMELTSQDIANACGRHIIRVREETVPYIRLREIFAISGKDRRPAIEHVVIVRIEDKQIGLVTDSIIGNHQAVIKSLGKVYEHTEGISGATILGDGTIALILDARQLKECSLHPAEERNAG